MKKPFTLAIAGLFAASLHGADQPKVEPKQKPAPVPAVAAPAILAPAVIVAQPAVVIEAAPAVQIQRAAPLHIGVIRMLQPNPGGPESSVIVAPGVQPGSRRNIEAVYLQNGDIISGKFVGIDPKDGLLWEHPNIKPAMKIDPASVARITFAQRPAAAGPKRQTSRVELNNGDKLAGDLFELNAQRLVLKTWYGGDLVLNRAALQTVVPGEEILGALYDGPTDAKDWEFSNAHAANNAVLPANLPAEHLGRIRAQSSGTFQYKDGGFESTGVGAQVGRNFELPDKVNIEFDMEWTTTMSLFVNLYTDQIKSTDQGNTYSLRLSQNNAWLYKYERGDNFSRSSHVGTAAQYNLNTQLGARPMAHVSIRVDKQQKTIALVLNGQFINKWTDTGNFAGKGKAIVFSTRTTYPVRLSAIRLSQWDGRLPGKVEAAGGNEKEDFVRLANSDTLSGNLLGIKEGKMNFKTPFADDLPIPLNRVSIIRFAKVDAPIAAIKNPVRITLKNQGQITCTLKEWKGGKVQLTSPTLGEATFDASAIESLEFNVNTTTAQTPATPAATSATATTRINVNGADVPLELLQQIQGAGGQLQFNFNGAQLQIQPFLNQKRILPIAPPPAPDIKRD